MSTKLMTISDKSILRMSNKCVARVCVCILQNIKHKMYFSLGVDRWINSALQIISCAFLLMTLLVYLCVPSLQNLHGKTFMGYIGTLLLVFTCLLISTWIKVYATADAFEGMYEDASEDVTVERSTTTCKTLGSYTDIRIMKY